MGICYKSITKKAPREPLGAATEIFCAFFAWILSLSVVVRCYSLLSVFCLAFLPVFALNFSAAFIAVVYCEYCGVLGGLVGELIIGGK